MEENNTFFQELSSKSFFIDSSFNPINNHLGGNVSYFRSSFDGFDENKQKEISSATAKFEDFVKNLHNEKKQNDSI